MPLGDLDDRQHQAEDEIIGELALVAGDEAQDDGLGLSVASLLDDDAFLDDRLVDLVLDVLHERAEFLERNDDLGRDERGPEPFDDHQLETVLPLVVGDLLAQDLPWQSSRTSGSWATIMSRSAAL